MNRFLYQVVASIFLLVGLMSVINACRDDDSFVPLSIHAVEPEVVLVGDTVVLIGEGFSPGYEYNEITFSGSALVVRPLAGSSTEKLYVRVPDGATSGPVQVNILDEEIQQSPVITIMTPVLDNINPQTGWRGDTVVITGKNFRKEFFANHVRFNGLNTDAFATVIGASSTTVKAVVPADSRTGHVSVLGFNGPVFTLKPSEVTAVSPTMATVGELVTITGKGLPLAEGTQIVFAGTIDNTAVLQPGSTPSALKVIVPAGAQDGVLKIQYPASGMVEIASDVQFQLHPSIQQLSPRNGLPGSVVKITGYGFREAPEDNIVYFNGVRAQVQQASRTALTVIAPDELSTGPVQVSVQGRTTTGPVFTLSPAGSPVVYQLLPDKGPVGSTVVMEGDHFSAVPAENIVTFSGAKTGAVQYATTSLLRVTVPVGAVSGPITIQVGNKTGTAPDFSITAKVKPVITSVSPVSIGKGQTFTVYGANFSNALTGINVILSGPSLPTMNLAPQSGSSTQLDVTVPTDAVPGEYNISLSQNGELSNNDRKIQISGQPVIKTLSATEGQAGSIILLTGVDFNSQEAKNVVKFGSTPATIVDVSDSEVEKVRVYVPDVPAGVYNVTLTAFGNTSNSIAFTVKDKAVSVKNVYYLTFAPPNTAQIKKSVFDPPAIQTIYEKNGVNLTALVMDLSGSKAYFAIDGAIGRSNLNGTNAETLFDASETQSDVYDLSLDPVHEYIYWSSSNALAIYRGKMNGSGAPELLYDNGGSGIEYVTGITYLDSQDKLYFIDLNSETFFGRIWRASPNGSGTPELLFDDSDGLENTYDIKIDAAGGKMYILDQNGSGTFRLMRGNLDGSGSLTVLYEFSESVGGIALDVEDQFIYWSQGVQGDKGSVWRARFDFQHIPGTSPASAVQRVYSDINFVQGGGSGLGGGAGGLAVEESTRNGSTQRKWSMGATGSLKYRRKK